MIPDKALRIVSTVLLIILCLLMFSFPLFVKPEIVAKEVLHQNRNNKSHSESPVLREVDEGSDTAVLEYDRRKTGSVEETIFVYNGRCKKQHFKKYKVKKMRIHKEGQAIVLGVLIIFMVLYVLIAHFSNYNALYYNSVGIAGLLFLFFILFFFRNPTRKISTDDSIVFASADGKIIAIEEVFETEFLNRKCVKVSIFMSIWNIHVNRYPISGQITYTNYHPGKYLIAHHPKSSELNEHQTIVIEKTNGTDVMIKQIAGIVARRIISYAKKGQYVEQGDDLGFIRFGSRVDIFIPLNTSVLVLMGELVKGNKTMIARFNN